MEFDGAAMLAAIGRALLIVGEYGMIAVTTLMGLVIDYPKQSGIAVTLGLIALAWRGPVLRNMMIGAGLLALVLVAVRWGE
jgi:hypothetical protein